MGCCNNPNYQSRAARESINRSAYEACQCATQACECKDVAVQAQIAAQASAESASSDANQSEAIWNDFQTRYLGAYPSDPTTTSVGALYFNTTSNEFYVWNGAFWQLVTSGGGGGAPLNSSYVVMSSDPTLFNERVLTQAKNITITDGGANNPVTVATVVQPEFDAVQIDTTPTAPVTPAVGKMFWNDTDGTIEFGLKGGNVNLQVGQENIVQVKNDHGSPLAVGEVVYISGANGINLLVKKAQANSDATSARTIGLVAEPLAVNGIGFIVTFGVLKGVNTNAFNDGDILYLSPTTAGGITNVKPSAPQHLVLVGFCQKKSGGAGEIFVEIQNGYELEELHNVQINSGTLANNDLLAYNSATSTWQNKTSSTIGLVSSVTATGPITSSGGSTPVISTSMATNRLIGRSTAGTGVMEEITVGTGLSLSGGTLSSTAITNVVQNVPADTTPVNTLRALTQVEYDAIPVKDPNTIYFIKP